MESELLDMMMEDGARTNAHVVFVDDEQAPQTAAFGIANALPAVPTDIAAVELSDLLRGLRDCEREVEALTIALDRAKERERLFSTKIIPEKMDMLGFSSMTTSDGSVVELKPFVNISVIKDQVAKAHDWLEEIGEGGMIKHTIAVPFGRSDEDDAQVAQLRQTLSDAGYSYTDTTKVEPSTLRAMAKRRLAAGGDFPADLFTVFAGRETNIGKPKKRSGERY